MTPPTPTAAAWTSPFGSLLPSLSRPQARDGHWHAPDADARTAAALRHYPTVPATVPAQVDGRDVTVEAALDAAAALLAASGQPLFGGLGADVDGIRALHALARRTGAILDHGHGDALEPGLRTQQDRGAVTASLGELHRADLVLCLGTTPSQTEPQFFARARLDVPRREDDTAAAPRRVVFLGTPVDPALAGREGVEVEQVGAAGDLFTTVSLLAALVVAETGRRRAPPGAPPPLVALARQLHAAPSVLVIWEGARLPAQGALIVESVRRLIETLLRHTRATSFALGGGDGAATAVQVLGWLTGLPPRTRLAADGPDHDPVRYASAAALGQGLADLLLWTSAFAPDALPPPSTPPGLPRIVLGHPALAPAARASGASSVFLPVSTPGIGSEGLLFRCDGLALPLQALYRDSLPTVAATVQALRERLA